MKRLVLFLLSFFLLSPLSVLAAQGEGIASFDSQIYVDRHNVVTITENIVYDFADGERHGIYRDIPTAYNTADGNYYTSVKFIEAQIDGAKVQNDISEQSDITRFKLGDPNKTVTGTHTYTIKYSLSPLVVKVGNRDRLLLDITGDAWPVPIDKATAKFTFEGDAQLTEVQCFAGYSGSTDQNCSSADGTFTATNLAAGQGMTVNGYLPTGYVDRYLEPGKRPWTANRIFELVLLLGLAFIGLSVASIFGLRYWRERQLKSQQTIIAQYEPPNNMKPAEIGLLEDDTSNIREVTATLIDLAVRGFIKIEQTSPKKFLRKAKYTLHKLKPFDLEPYEQTLINSVFDGADQVELDKVDRVKVSNAVSSFNSQVKDRLKGRGFYGTFKDKGSLLDKAVNVGNVTEAGAEEWAKVEGFKLYMSVVEKDRLNFSDAPDKTPERFNALLPYAIALGVEKQWAKQFQGIDVTSGQNWYGSHYGTWTALSLADDLGGGFASAASSSFAAPSSSSGGGSGGGFGGGGGGSW